MSNTPPEGYGRDRRAGHAQQAEVFLAAAREVGELDAVGADPEKLSAVMVLLGYANAYASLANVSDAVTLPLVVHEVHSLRQWEESQAKRRDDIAKVFGDATIPE